MEEEGNIMSVVSAARFVGHRKGVTALDVSGDERQLLSGSEDKTVRLWDCQQRRGVKCMLECFDTAIEGVAYNKREGHIIYAVTSRNFYSFDTRMEGNVLTKIPTTRIDNLVNEAINALISHQDGSMLAIGDDAGVVSVYEIDNNNCDITLKRRYEHVHSNLVGALSFSTVNNSIASGGFDCVACSWDIDTGVVISSENISTQSLVDGAPQVINPPFIQSISYIRNDSLLALALGDGTIRLLNSHDKSLVSYTSEDAGHRGMVSTLQVVNDHYCVTGGIDRTIRFWDVVEKKIKKGKKVSNRTDITPLLCLDHCGKINVVRTSQRREDDNLFAKPFYVGDVSSVITEYRVTGR